MIKRVLIVSFVILCSQGVIRAQSLLHSKPLDYNSGFAGAKTYDRISFHGNEFSSNSQNVYFSYDKLVKKLKGGIGLYGNRRYLNNDFLQNGLETSLEHHLNTIGAAYSPKYIVAQKVLISPSAVLSAHHYQTEFKQAINETDAIILEENPDNFFGAEVGILANTKKGYLGYQLKNQLWLESGINQLHSFQAGYVYTIAPKINFMVDAKYNYGEQIELLWRNYNSQINLAYQYHHLFIGAGLNDTKYISALAGVKLKNLKVNAAYHVLSADNFANVEFGVQYTFDPNNDEKINLPFRKWLLKLKM